MPNSEAKYAAIVQRTLHQVEKIAPDIGDAVVPVWRESNNGELIHIGTAFFAERCKRSFLVTALHNFKNLSGASLKIKFSGKIWTLNEMNKRISTDDDLWVAETCAELHDCLQGIKVPLLLRDNPRDCTFGTGSVLLGYPEELNLQGEPFKPLAISTMLETRDLTTVSKLPEPIVYNVQSDFLSTACGKPVMERPDIFGMSGGPVFSWYCTEGVNGSPYTFHYFLQGVILSWQERNGYVVACNAARIATLLGADSKVQAPDC
ncbi:hypothetical protein CTTA_3695 [Comamonas testosteroni]|uniref:Trypsin-like peptidase domain-containing protein n=1 Tax=Comamonas testosteroni TaxID=285 RepID=A0A5A7MGR5_COMTE|nr:MULTISPECIES: hypothetical protein [Comamonas]BDR09925.1 serine protease [Comamonas thiooxydans]GEQ76690.1 hypothetical protein CTTA_3695 [Comamonas testosteroni]